MLKNRDMFSGMDKVETAIARLKNFEPPAGYYLAYSGGKDSVVLLDLAKKAGVRYDAHYNITTIDPPALVQFIKTQEGVVMDHPPLTMGQLIIKRGLPRRQARYCCEALKERGGSGRIVLTGVRWQESAKRRRRGMVENCYKDKTKRFVHPIIDWSEDEVWEYIKENNISYCSLYDAGEKRLGCVLCPMTRNIDYQLEHYPKTVASIKRAAKRFWDRQTPGAQRFTSFEEMWGWWLDRAGSLPQTSEPQSMMFDSTEFADGKFTGP